MPAPTAADLEAEQQRLAAEAARLQEQAAEARRKEAERLEKQRDRDARALLKSYDEGALDQQVREAEARLRRAILDDPVHAAAIELLAARIIRYEQGLAVVAAAHRLNQTAPAAAPVGALDLPEYVDRLIHDEAANLAEDRREGKG